MSKSLGRRLSAEQVAYQQTLQGLKNYQINYLGLRGDVPTEAVRIAEGTQGEGRPLHALLPVYARSSSIDQVPALEQQFNLVSTGVNIAKQEGKPLKDWEIRLRDAKQATNRSNEDASFMEGVRRSLQK